MRRATLSGMLGLASLIPFLVLELRNNPPGAGFPFFLFGTLWLLGAAFAAVLLPAVRDRQRRGAVLVRVALSIVIACLWAQIVADQMPCFLGAPNCD
jgi:hypothetical protein